MQERPAILRFTPSRTKPEILESILVQRHALLEDVIERIEESATTDNKHHLLFIGPRGCGKTHLISIIDYRLQNRSELLDKLRIAWLNEDETSTSFLDLLLRIYRVLASRYEGEFDSDELQALYELSESQALKKIKQLISNKLENRTLVLLTENLDDLFAGIGEQGQKQWRAFIQENPAWVVIATSQRLFSGISRRNSPFWGFFQIEHLKLLSLAEATQLLQRILRYHDEPELNSFLASPLGNSRIKAIYHLSGGNHRVYIILSEFITRESLDQLVTAFEKMLDELTPYYQERMRWLAPQQRKIVEYLCRCEKTVAVKEIAKHLFITHQTTSSQLKDLRYKGYVISHKRGRESLYELGEPLMRLCIEVKENRLEPIRLIVKFLRVWYTKDQLSDALKFHKKNHSTEKYIIAAINESFINLDKVSSIYSDDSEISASEECASKASQKRVEAALKRGYEFLSINNLKKAIHEFESVIEMKDIPINVKALALNNRGDAYAELDETEKAIADFNLVIEMKDEPYLAKIKTDSLFSRGTAYAQAGETEKAICDLSAVIELKDADTFQKNNALANRWVVYTQVGETGKANSDFRAVIESKNASTDLKARTYVNRGLSYAKAGETVNAINDFSFVIEMKDVSANLMAIALSNRRLVYNQIGEIAKSNADNTALLELEHIPDDYKATALNIQGVNYDQADKNEQALSCFEQAISLIPENPLYHFNQVISLLRLSQWNKGWESLEMALQRFPPEQTRMAGNTAAMISIIEFSTIVNDIWKGRITKLVAIYREAKALDFLGKGLVQSLKCTLSVESILEAWLQSWEDVCASEPELRIPLRIFKAGVYYINTRNPQVLYELTMEERSVLQEVLKIELKK